MKKFFLITIGCLILDTGSYSQDISQRIQQAYTKFETDSQLKHAISSLYVIDAKTGEVVFDKNSQIGLAGASTQKIITAATAFELLGKTFRYKTEFRDVSIAGTADETKMILIQPSGDPTFGSWRYTETLPANFFQSFSSAMKKTDLFGKKIFYTFYNRAFEVQHIPDGWIWQDIGNYYGAGSGAFNWKENQSDIYLSSGPEEGDAVRVEAIDTLVGTGFITNALKTGPKNSGDNAYYYFLYGNSYMTDPVLKGTIPPGEKKFKISVAVANPFIHFSNELKSRKLADANFDNIGLSHGVVAVDSKSNKLIYTHYSPALDSIVYWFLKKSINLYGEALVKTFAYEKQGFGSTDSGTALVRKFWKEKGLDENELNIYDGSGLSPLNRITTHAQVEVLKYAKGKEWFKYFYDALPEFNGMKMKSGTISDVKGFCGYQKSKDGKEYIFSFIVNNYSGRTSPVVQKMYKVLDELK